MKKVRKTPHQQLAPMLQTMEQKVLLGETLAILSRQYQDDFCIACIAYIRFGIKRQFTNNLMNVLFLSYCDVLDR